LISPEKGCPCEVGKKLKLSEKNNIPRSDKNPRSLEKTQGMATLIICK